MPNPVVSDSKEIEKLLEEHERNLYDIKCKYDEYICDLDKKYNDELNYIELSFRASGTVLESIINNRISALNNNILSIRRNIEDFLLDFDIVTAFGNELCEFRNINKHSLLKNKQFMDYIENYCSANNEIDFFKSNPTSMSEEDYYREKDILNSKYKSDKATVEEWYKQQVDEENNNYEKAKKY